MTECNSKSDFDQATDLFKDRDFVDNPVYREKANKMIINLANQQGSDQYDEVQQAFFNSLILG